MWSLRDFLFTLSFGKSSQRTPSRASNVCLLSLDTRRWEAASSNYSVDIKERYTGFIHLVQTHFQHNMVQLALNIYWANNNNNMMENKRISLYGRNVIIGWWWTNVVHLHHIVPTDGALKASARTILQTAADSTTTVLLSHLASKQAAEKHSFALKRIVQWLKKL